MRDELGYEVAEPVYDSGDGLQKVIRSVKRSKASHVFSLNPHSRFNLQAVDSRAGRRKR